MKTEAKPTPKPAPHVLETMALRFEAKADEASRASIAFVSAEDRRAKLTQAIIWREAAKECRDALLFLEPDRKAGCMFCR
jgi:hypothetical protein